MQRFVKDLDIEEYRDFKINLYDRVIDNIMNNMGLAHIRIKCVFRDGKSNYQGGVKRAKSEKLDYIMFFFKYKRDDEWTTRLLALNTIKTIIHEVRHIYQIENGMFPEMLNPTEIPYMERPWENDAYEYSCEYYKEHREFFREVMREIEK